MTSIAVRVLEQLDRNDRRLLHRWSLGEVHPTAARWFWVGVTQCGSAVVTILAAAGVPILLGSDRPEAWGPAAALAASHVVVQVIKRSVQRGRPARMPVIPSPDRFSFPSGHATSSLAMALSLGALLPGWAPWFLVAGLLVGWSRVVPGVHYPGDVLAGQLIATLTVLALP